jgi:hypothetical protein
MIRKLGIAAALWLAAASAAHADDRYQRSECYGVGSQHLDTLRAGKVIRNSEAMALPDSVELTGQKFAAGTLVAITKTEGEYACVEAGTLTRGQETSGWIPASDIQIFPPALAGRPARWWIGSWQSGRSKITFRMQDGRLFAEGSSWWQGFGDPNIGDFSGHPFAHGDGLKVGDTDAPPALDENLDYCMLGLIAVGNRMAVEDNSHCGGMNVRFFGIYSRVHRRAAKH